MDANILTWGEGGKILFSPIIKPLSCRHYTSKTLLIMSDIHTSNPLDEIQNLSQDEHIELAIIGIRNAGKTAQGNDILSLRKAATIYQVTRQTLANRILGMKTRVKAHEHERNLTSAQEDVLVEWVKVMGRRGLPLTPTTITDYAAHISGKRVGRSWGTRFIKRHPDLKVRWTTGLEACRACTLNRHAVREFYDMLDETVKEFNIPSENIYNMDEKGIQMGIGKRVAALVDRDQKDIYQVENGNCQLVTIIETVSADGKALHPSVIYQGRRRDLEWGRHNPCNARSV